MSTYVKLGEAASMFFDPTTKVKVLPNQAVEVSNREKQSKKFKRAVAAGHLEKVSKDEAEKINSKQAKKVSKALAKKEDTPAKDEADEKPLNKMNKTELVAHGVANAMGTEEELDEMKKSDLYDYIVNYDEEAEEEEEEDEDEEEEEEDED